MTKVRWIVVSALVVGACTTLARGSSAPAPLRTNFPATWRFRAGESEVTAPNAMVVSNDAIASRVGTEIMRQGGNAVDAAVATGFALAVTFPVAGNIGGGGFMVIRLASGEAVALDYREIAPKAASRNMYLDSAGNVTEKSLEGHLSAGVPGSVAGMLEALRRYGTMTLPAVIAPAIKLAEEGFVVDSFFSRDLGDSTSTLYKYGGRIFYPNGKAVSTGTTFKQPELAFTLRQISQRGADGFYKGPVADSLVAEMRRGGGIISHEDLLAYKPIWRTPVRGTFRGYTLLSMPPASSGGITMTETLNVLETYDHPAPFGSTQWAHRLAEAYQRAFIDRNAKLGDPAFVQIPQDELTSKTYARSLRASIDDRRHTPTPVNTAAGRDGMHTTHYSVVDAKGNAVAVTTTINFGFGSGVWVRGAGFILNDEMDDFAAKPGSPNGFGLVQGEQNAIAPGKRMLSAMTPTVVLDPAGNVLLVVGAAGGPTIITGVSQVILNVIEHRMTLADAMRAPRLHHQALPDTLIYEKGGLAAAVVDSLRAMNHAVLEVGELVNINAIMRTRAGWHGVHEPRSQGAAVGY